MLRNCYSDKNSRRTTHPEAIEFFAQETGCLPVEGFIELLDKGDSFSDSSSTFDSYITRMMLPQYFVNLSLKKDFVIKTQKVPEICSGNVVFIFSMGFGNGHPLPQPSGKWEIFINGVPAISIRVVKHSFVWRNDRCSFIFSAGKILSAEPYHSIYLNELIPRESFAAFGTGLLVIPSDMVVAGENAAISIKGMCEDKSARWISFIPDRGVGGTEVLPVFHYSDIYRAVNVIKQRKNIKLNNYKIYFGDIHTHSGETTNPRCKLGCGWGTREENYLYTKGPGGLDFYALTDHEFQIGESKVDMMKYFSLADKYNENGNFVCIPGFEHTSFSYGHRNVYFENSNGIIVNTFKSGLLKMDPDDAVKPQELWNTLEKNRTKFLTVPHHPSAVDHPFNIDNMHPEYDRLIEVYSCWGSSEYRGDFPRGIPDRYEGLYARDALDKGWKLGIIASSDGHDGHPGEGQSFSFKHQHIYHFLGSGYVAVLAEELTRKDVFEALYNRRCYGTTGVPIALDFSVNGYEMGSIIPAVSEYPVLRVICKGTNGIDHIRIVKNGRVVDTVFGHGEYMKDLEWKDKEYNKNSTNYYYVRVVQVDRESAWSSPVWIG